MASTATSSQSTTANSTSSLGTSTSLFSQTFTAPTHDSVPTTSSNGGGGGDGSGIPANTGPQIASSASLYLYTFLATLVLLLSVSAAIILRSLVIRRRHRRLVEEAIANGTWLPPTQGPGGPSGTRARVDLSRKPKMWEAFVGDDTVHGEKADYEPRMERETEWDWDSIRPFSASYAPPPVAPIPLPPPVTTPTTQPEQPRISITRRIRQLISPTPAAPMVPLPSLGPGSHGNSSPNLLAAEGPKTLRVAVLIAMPSPTNSHYHHSHSRSQSSTHLNDPSSKSPSPSPSPLMLSPPSPSPSSSSPSPLSLHPSQSPLHCSPLSHTSSTPHLPEELELPHLEFGVAELVVREEQEKSDDEEGERGKDTRISVGSSVDVV